MAFALEEYTATGGETDFTITFPYQAEEDVLVKQNGTPLTQTTHYTFSTPTTIQLVTGATVDDIILLQRSTSQASRDVTFTAGVLTKEDLNNATIQALYMAQESIDIANRAMILDSSSEWEGQTKLLHNIVDPVANQDAATKNYVDSATLAPLPTPLALALGGTAATTASGALTNIGGLGSGDIGSTVQAHDADTAKTDVVQNFSASQSGTVTILTDAATIAVNFALSNNFEVTIAGNRTLGFPTNPVAGTSGIFVVKQDGTGGRTLAYATGYFFDSNSGTAVVTSTASAIDVLGYYVVDTSTIILTASLDWVAA